MDDKVNYAFVGAFVLALGAALTAGVLWLAAGLGGKRQFDVYESVFAESVAGLNIDAPVKYLGVDVGKVRQIAIDPRNPNQVRLRLLIERGTPVKRDTEAVLKTQGLTGIAYIELDGGSPDAPALVAQEEGGLPLIHSKPSLAMRMESEIGGVLSNLNRLAGNLNALLDGKNREALAQTLADARTLMQTLARQRGAIGAGLADAARAAAGAASAAAQLAPTLGRIDASAQALQGMAENVDRAATDVTRAADTITRAADAATRGVDAATGAVRHFDRETLVETQHLLAELNALTAALRRTVEHLRQQPSGLLLGSPTTPPGPGERAPP